jgi:hypothetical protein
LEDTYAAWRQHVQCAQAFMAGGPVWRAAAQCSRWGLPGRSRRASQIIAQQLPSCCNATPEIMDVWISVFEIRGFLPGNELAYLAKTFDLHNPVGTWLEDCHWGGRLWAITEEDGTLYLSVFGKSGLRTSKGSLTEIQGLDGRVFVRTEGSGAGEYYTMLPSGWLKIADNDVLFAMCKPVGVRAGGRT